MGRSTRCCAGASNRAVLEHGVEGVYTARRPQIDPIGRKTRITCNPEPAAIAWLTRFGRAAWGVPKLNVAGSPPVARYRDPDVWNAPYGSQQPSRGVSKAKKSRPGKGPRQDQAERGGLHNPTQPPR